MGAYTAINRKKNGKFQKFCVLHTVFFLFPSSLLMVTSPVPLLSENHRNNYQLSLEKNLEWMVFWEESSWCPWVIRTSGKLIPGLWLIELQTCQSDNFNSLWLVRWNVQLSFTCSWTISPCHETLLQPKDWVFMFIPSVLPLVETRQKTTLWSVFS